MKYVLPLFIVLLSFGSFTSVQSQSIDTMTVYPNPVVDILTVNIQTSIFSRFDLDCFDITGKKVWSPVVDSIMFPGTHEFTYDVSFLDNGVYLLKIKDASGDGQVEKFFKNGPVSIAKISNDQSLIYPNPSIGWIQIPEKTLDLNVFDFAGKLVMSFSNPSSQVDVSELKNGLYIIELIGESSKRVILEIQK